MILMIVAFVSGFIISYVFSGKKTGDKGPFGFIRIPISKKKYIHLHHWLIFMIGIIIFRKYFTEHIYALSFVIGIIFEDFKYKDFSQFIYTYE